MNILVCEPVFKTKQNTHIHTHYSTLPMTSTKRTLDNTVVHEGEWEEERLVREFSSGAKRFVKGERGRERLVREEYSGGYKRVYEGGRGRERLVREEESDGDKYFYEGEKGSERLVRWERWNGVKRFYEGERGSERIVNVERASGEKQFFEGEKDNERLVRIEDPDGHKFFYEGERGSERIVRMVEHLIGRTTYSFFEWSRGNRHEVLVRPKITWATYRKQFRFERLAWYWFGLAGKPGGKAHADAVSSFAYNTY